MQQLTFTDNKNKHHQHTIYVVLDNLNDPRNVGMLFRLADAFGVSALFLCGSTPRPPSDKIKRTARGADSKIPYYEYAQTSDALHSDLLKDTTVIAVEITQTSIPIETLVLKTTAPITLVLGAEEKGIAENTLLLCNNATHITMYGVGLSMNVTHAAAIALHEVTKQLHA